MAGSSRIATLRQVDRLFREGTLGALADDQLLARFVERADQEAFAALVARHGPMVFAACRSALRDPAGRDHV